VFDGKLASLRRFKDDVREVAAGFECGISLEGYDEMQNGDIIESYRIEEIARTL
jgi:translation initiation factor IF-2